MFFKRTICMSNTGRSFCFAFVFVIFDVRGRFSGIMLNEKCRKALKPLDFSLFWHYNDYKLFAKEYFYE